MILEAERVIVVDSDNLESEVIVEKLLRLLESEESKK